MDNRVTVTIDINHPGAKSLLENLESLDYVKVNTVESEGACENKNTFLCRSVEEMDSIRVMTRSRLIPASAFLSRLGYR